MVAHDVIVGGPHVTSLPAAYSFGGLSSLITLGDILYVVEHRGQATKGAVHALSDVALELTVDDTRRRFREDTIRRIERRDSVRNGVLVGLGTGAAIGFFLGRRADGPGPCSSGSECGQGAMMGTVGGALWGGIAGWIVDALKEPEVVYQSPR